MQAEKKVITNLTFLDKLINGPLEKQRRVIVTMILSIGAIASALAIWFEVISHETNIVDIIFLPVMAILFTSLVVLLIREPEQRQTIERIAFIILVVYTFFMLIYQIRVTLPKQHTFSEVILWYPMLYLASFLLHRRAIAMRTAVSIWLLLFVTGIIFTPYGYLLKTSSISAINSLMQFYISGLAYILLLYAFSRIEEGYAETRLLAYVDHLTQLPNRRYGESMLVQLLQQAREYKSTFSTIMIDLDSFKRVNDLYGHDVGDRVLKRCALLIQRYLPRGARVIRWGGEEFLVILPDHDERQAQLTAEEIRQGFESSPHERVGVVLASFGVAGLRKGDTLDELIMRADRAMYRAKKQGGNRVVAASTLSLVVDA